jgi:hypothetical protein
MDHDDASLPIDDFVDVSELPEDFQKRLKKVQASQKKKKRRKKKKAVEEAQPEPAVMQETPLPPRVD